MPNVDELTDKLLSRLGVHQRHGYNESQPSRGAPPPVPQYRPPPLPPRINLASRPLQTGLPYRPTPGAIYAPGTYPTPELLPYPIGKHFVLSNPASYTSQAIQQQLDSLGPKSALYLPQRTRWAISTTLVMKAYQELATEGYPTSPDDMAWLDATEDLEKHVLQGIGAPSLRIRNIAIDAGREKYGHSDKCECVVRLGGDCGGGNIGRNQIMDHCIIQHPRQWSCLQVAEGGESVHITNNFIGPAGYGADVGSAGKWADGISYGAFNGLIAGNQILDATDGAMVIFGAPGTLVTSNTIITRSRLCLGAINMVDFKPHSGNYQYTRVIHNTIRSEGSMIKIGIGQGCPSWWDPQSPRDYLRGAIVMHNLIEASPNSKGQMGYGFAVSDVEDWICTDNRSAEGVTYDGDLSEGIDPTRGKFNIAPGPFVRSVSAPDGSRGPRRSTLQSEFVEGQISGLICIKPGQSDVRAFSGGQFSLRLGERVTLRDIELEFDIHGQAKLLDRYRNPIWMFNQPMRQPLPPNLMLSFLPNSKLGIMDGHNLINDFTPSLSPSGWPTSSPPAVDKPILVLSGSGPPYLTITSPNGSLLVAAPPVFTAKHDWKINPYPTGPFVARPSWSGYSTLVTLLSPYGKFIVLETTNGIEMDLPIRFGQNGHVEGRWKQIWSSCEPKKEQVDESGKDTNATLAFQGDGNLVLYSSRAGVIWATGTHDVKPVLNCLKFGSGSSDDPPISLVDANGKIGWKT